MRCERPNALNFVWNLGKQIGFGLDGFVGHFDSCDHLRSYANSGFELDVFVRISGWRTVIGEHHGSGDVGGLAGCRIEGRQY